jgi:hypothetical protein
MGEWICDRVGEAGAMGPITLFDKSFLQSISTDEAVWFDHFFMAVVCPIFYVETLADLAKEPSKRRTPEDIVRDIANKFPELGGGPCGSRIDLSTQNLLGNEVVMDGRVPRPGGRLVKAGVIFEATPEEQAFRRWHQGQFKEAERLAAAVWRKQLSELDMAAVAKEFRALGIDGKKVKSLDQARDMAQAVIKGTTNPQALLALCVLFLHIPANLHQQIYRAWEAAGRRSLDQFAPYAAYVLSIEIFFQIALAAHLIDSGRPSNRTDISYLFYLPFCMIFISSDHLHRRCAPLFLRSDQEFVWGVDLKQGLTLVNTHFLQLSEAEREKGIMSFAHAPPVGNAVADVWDRHMRDGYREETTTPRNRDPEKDAELLKRLKEFTKLPTLPPEEHRGEEEMMSIKRSVRRKRGNWWQVPKDLPDPANDDAD